MRILGVTDHRFLGGPGRYRDSGMIFDETGYATAAPEVKDGTFWRADLLEAAALLVEIIREVRPQVLVTYDEFGNYGHPDHIQAHRVSTYAAALAPVAAFGPDLGCAVDDRQDLLDRDRGVGDPRVDPQLASGRGHRPPSAVPTPTVTSASG